ncbi:MAG: 60S ribosomal export protein NMD3 [Thermoplasmata archaeon]
MFCVECGAEGKVYQSLCEKCFLEKHKLAQLPEILDIEMCKECGSFLIDGKWVRTPMERAIEMLLDSVIMYEKSVNNSQLTVEHSPEDEKNISIRVHCDMYVEDLRAEKVMRSKVRIKTSQCITCTRRKSKYYEAILQVRAEGRNLSDDELESIHQFVHERVDAASEAFISQEEKLHGGIDFYLSSRAVARNLSKELAALYTAQERSSAKLVGRKDGQDLFRVTHSVRLPGYRVGDVILHKGRLYSVENMATTVTAVDLEDMKRCVFAPPDLAGSKVEACSRLKAVVLSQTEEEIQIMDPETLKALTLKKPEGYHPSGEEVPIIKCERGVFLAPTQKD